MKNEIKVEITETSDLVNFLDSVYFTEECKGKLTGKHSYEINNDENKKCLRGMNNIPIRITNEKIDGTLRCIVNEDGDKISINPVSVYCIKENRYNFW